MNIVLLSGGSGKRLWPLSNDIRSKQFLKVIPDENSNSESMLQRVYKQLEKANLSANVTIATSSTQVESIRSQLGEKVSIVVEPQRRNTYPAIALACAKLYFEQRCKLDETVVVLPIDPYVDPEYFQTISCLDKAVQQDASQIVLMGVKPTYPSEKYGYIIPKTTDKTVNSVDRFKEKPSLAVAKELIAAGGLWNCGVFAFKLGYIVDMLQAKLMCHSYEDVFSQYNKLTNDSFDYEVVEKSQSISVVTYAGDWKDLGTWNTLAEVMNQDPIGNCILADTCVNTHVINELDVPLVVMGAKDMMVVASPDGILVSDKYQSSFIKQYVNDLDQRPMFEERQWGEYKVLDIILSKNNKVTTKKKTIRAQHVIPMTSHNDHAEVWTVLTGKCILSIDGRNHDAFAGDTFTIAKGVNHNLTAVDDCIILETQICE